MESVVAPLDRVGKIVRIQNSNDTVSSLPVRRPLIGLPLLSNVKAGAVDLWSDGRGVILITVACGWALSMGVRMVYPVLLPQIRVQYDLDLSTAGMLLTVLFLAYALGQLPGGLLADRIGERKILIVSTLVAAGTLFLVVTANSVIVLFGATALFGCGIALYAVARFTLLAGLYPDRLGSANGVAAAASDVGQSVLPALAGLIAVSVTWQYGFGFAVPLYLLAAVGLWTTVPAQSIESSSAVDTLSLASVRYVLSALYQPPIIRVTAILTLGLSIWQAFTGFYPTYLIEIKELSPVVASGLFGLFFALGVAIKPISGGAYDRFGIRRSIPVLLGATALALALLPFVEGTWPLAALTALVSTLLGYGTIAHSFLLETVSNDIQGTGMGVVRTFSFSVGAFSPTLFGTAADNGLFDEALLVLAALAVIMIGLAWSVPDR